MQEFEYDPRKSSSNSTKHGMDFEQAQALWRDPALIEVPANTDDEPRSLVIARLDGRHWAAVITYRSGRIRLISVRRARQEEVLLYESQDV